MNIRSALEIPHLRAASGDAVAVDIAFGHVPMLDDTDPARFRNWVAEPDRFVIEVAGIARIRVTGGAAITVDPAPGASARDLAVYVVGCGLAALLQQRGMLPLHASAVATPHGAVLVAGGSGAGKSTLALALVAGGFALVADDVSAVTADAAGCPIVHAAFPAMRLWKDTALASGIQVAGLDRVRDGLKKYYVPVADFSPGPHPVAALVVLSVHNDAVTIERPAAGERMAEIARNIYRRKFLHGQQLHHVQFDLGTRLAQSATTLRVRRPEHAADRFELRDRVLEALELHAVTR